MSMSCAAEDTAEEKGVGACHPREAMTGEDPELDDGPVPAARSRSARRQVRQRMCAVTRQRTGADNLLRFVLGPDDVVVPDIKAVLPGRGMWLDARWPIVEEAVRRKAFARGFKKPVHISEGLSAQIGCLFAADLLSVLRLANKAGVVVCGFEKVAVSLRSGTAAVVLHAADAGQDGQDKLNTIARRRARLPEVLQQEACARTIRQQADRSRAAVPVLNLLPRQDLGPALGRANVVHVALSDHALTRTFLAAARRYARYTGTGSEFDAAATGAAANTE